VLGAFCRHVVVVCVWGSFWWDKLICLGCGVTLCVLWGAEFSGVGVGGRGGLGFVVCGSGVHGVFGCCGDWDDYTDGCLQPRKLCNMTLSRYEFS